jgi:hypothetical protein
MVILGGSIATVEPCARHPGFSTTTTTLTSAHLTWSSTSRDGLRPPSAAMTIDADAQTSRHTTSRGPPAWRCSFRLEPAARASASALLDSIAQHTLDYGCYARRYADGTQWDGGAADLPRRCHATHRSCRLRCGCSTSSPSRAAGHGRSRRGAPGTVRRCSRSILRRRPSSSGLSRSCHSGHTSAITASERRGSQRAHQVS